MQQLSQIRNDIRHDVPNNGNVPNYFSFKP